MAKAISHILSEGHLTQVGIHTTDESRRGGRGRVDSEQRESSRSRSFTRGFCRCCACLCSSLAPRSPFVVSPLMLSLAAQCRLSLQSSVRVHVSAGGTRVQHAGDLRGRPLAGDGVRAALQGRIVGKLGAQGPLLRSQTRQSGAIGRSHSRNRSRSNSGGEKRMPSNTRLDLALA